MGASTQKKTRQAARVEGTDRKTNAQLKEQKERKKEKIKWTVIAAAIVVFFGFVFYLNSGAFYRNLTGMTVSYPADEKLGIEAGEQSFSVAECNYIYNTQFINLANSYGEYASIIGLDTQSKLDEQECTMFRPEGLAEEESYTWHDYFTEATRTYLTQLAVMNAYAAKQGITLDEDDYAAIDENIATFDQAKEYGYASADKFVAGNYGKGTNLKVVRAMLEVQQLATKASQSVYDSYEFTAAELKAEYEAHKDSYDVIGYDFYLVEAKADEPAEDAEEGAAPTYSDEALKAAKATADEIYAKMAPAEPAEGGEPVEAMSLEAALKEVVGADAKLSSEEKAGEELDEALSEWLLDSKRVENDAAALEADNGAYVVVFKSRDNNQHKTDESGDMNYCDYIADGLLRSEKLEAWNAEVLTPVCDASTLDTGFGAKYIKR